MENLEQYTGLAESEPDTAAEPSFPTSPSRRRMKPLPFLGFETHEEAAFAMQAFQSLSGREVTVLACLAHGLSAKEVANTLKLSSRTVDTFRTRALLKLRARNTVDAVRILASLSAGASLAPSRPPNF
jgi:DNA-binding NarL/FixJ family response regulator